MFTSEAAFESYHWPWEKRQFSKKNYSLCLFQSIVHKKDDVQVIQLCKKLSKISSKAKTARQFLDLGVVKDLLIFWFVDEYNHNMNHVDQIHHLQGSYNTLEDHKF